MAPGLWLTSPAGWLQRTGISSDNPTLGNQVLATFTFLEQICVIRCTGGGLPRARHQLSELCVLHAASASEVTTEALHKCDYYYYYLTPVLNSQGMKKLRYAIQKVQKSSWNEPYSSSSFTKVMQSDGIVILFFSAASRNSAHTFHDLCLFDFLVCWRIQAYRINWLCSTCPPHVKNVFATYLVKCRTHVPDRCCVTSNERMNGQI